ncbi:iron-containing redox enzyme family protein [Halomonas ventosae]|uniref:Heme oxygenase-like protein n=1 Tax=Halomonas ventosae TaxID=229007 RepID=A0A4R6HVN7_9GAMM|nr:iron-containing redox enzyme family protein [Halomonas ventosae]TDO12681.1 heme oxygenase-like protein [Halomonas ventosae]
MIQLSDDILDWIEKSVCLPPNDWEDLNNNFSLRKKLNESSRRLADAAFKVGDRKSREKVHKCLAAIYNLDFSTATVDKIDAEVQPILRDIASVLEKAVLDYEISLIPESSLAAYPRDGKEYVKWLKKLISSHKSSVHPVYNDYISEHADADDLAFYLIQESSLDPRFDDILALMQIGLPVDQKLELGQNYWDEMGNGEPEKVHSHLFQSALYSLGISSQRIKDEMLPEALVQGNLSACLALSRRHYFKAVGYFGVTEYLAPRRFKHVVKAWRRNELPEVGIEYHDLHIVIDTQHANGWFNNVVAPLVEEDPAIGRDIALGAAIRLSTSSRYLDQLLKHFETNREAASL